MEKPGAGRTIINDHLDNIQVIIPAKINWLVLLSPIGALAAWWVIEGKSIAGRVIHQGKLVDFDWFLIIWFTIVIVITVRNIWWIAVGKEVITVGQGVLSVKKKGSIFALTKTYDLNEARLFRTEDNNEYHDNSFWDNYRTHYRGVGVICFEYGVKTIRFGEGLSEAEGNYILQQLQGKNALMDKHFL